MGTSRLGRAVIFLPKKNYAMPSPPPPSRPKNNKKRGKETCLHFFTSNETGVIPQFFSSNFHILYGLYRQSFSSRKIRNLKKSFPPWCCPKVSIITQHLLLTVREFSLFYPIVLQRHASKAGLTLKHLAELTATRARLLSRFLLCAVNFRENFASWGGEKNSIMFYFFASEGKILNVWGRCELLARKINWPMSRCIIIVITSSFFVN